MFVFMNGYPMTEKGFYSLVSKAIFGDSVRLSKRLWIELHCETKLLCEGLDLELREGIEAVNVIMAIKKAICWGHGEIFNKDAAMNWLEEVTRKLEGIRDQDRSNQPLQ